MVFNRFNVQVMLRLVSLALTSLAVSWMLQLNGYWFVKANLILFIGIQIYFFFVFLTRWKRDLRVFATSVQHDDYTITFNREKDNDAFFELYAMLNDISGYVRRIKSDYVQQNYYFEYMVENAQVGMLVYDAAGEVMLCNREALRLVGTGVLRRMEHLRHLNPDLHRQLDQLPLNIPKLLVLKGNEVQKMSARLSKILVDGRDIFLLSLLNIRIELEENELQSWQDLINVLTHEIMNSVTPINSLTGSMLKYMDRIEGNGETVARAKNSLQVISRRSSALMEFVQRYRAISDVPLPRIQETDVSVIINSVLILLETELRDVEVKVAHQHEVIYADISQIEQVMINMLRNALHAMEDRPAKKISLRVEQSLDRSVILISDNGRGIPEEILDRIFIPFYTTRRGGSGIGLTLSKQIMHRHSGYIEVSSEEGKGTTFRLVFGRNLQGQ